MSEKNSELLEFSNPVRKYVPEGSTIIFEAPQRRGKTLAMVIFALDAYHKERSVFSNIQLGFPHEPLDFRDVQLEDGGSKFWNGHIAIDELNFYFDSRRSMSGPNLEFGAFLLQQKKQGCNLTGTTHDLQYLDVRLRYNYDYLIRPTVFPAHPDVPKILRLEIENGPTHGYLHKIVKMPCEQFLGLYDSYAVYDPFKEIDDEEESPRRKPQKKKWKSRATL